MSVFNCSFKCWKVNLTQCSFINVNIDKIAVDFFIISGKVLYARSDTSGLHSDDVLCG